MATTAAVKVINKPTVSNNSIGTAVVTTAKKMLIKSEPPHLTNFQSAKVNKPNIIGSGDAKMVQIPLAQYTELLTELRELKERVSTLEEHCERSSGFVRK